MWTWTYATLLNNTYRVMCVGVRFIGLHSTSVAHNDNVGWYYKLEDNNDEPLDAILESVNPVQSTGWAQVAKVVRHTSRSVAQWASKINFCFLVNAHTCRMLLLTLQASSHDFTWISLLYLINLILVYVDSCTVVYRSDSKFYEKSFAKKESIIFYRS